MKSADSLEKPVDDNCAFCAYLREERPYTILEKSQSVAILVTREQRGIGHVLVVPTAHRRSILEMHGNESSEIMDALVRVSRAIDAAYQRPGIAIWQNNGIPAHQKIPHLHFHVAGTLDEGGTQWGSVPELSLAETERIASKIRPHLA